MDGGGNDSSTDQLDPVVVDVLLAADGDESAWGRLVDRHISLTWAIARSYRLSDADASDVVQTAWLRLVENLGNLHDKARVGAWLATTTRREALRVLRARRRESTLDESVEVVDLTLPPPEHRLVARERADALWSAFERLSDNCRQLLRVLMATPPPHYEEVSRALDMPVGSIGPTRQRCLAALRKNLVAAGITAGSGDS